MNTEHLHYLLTINQYHSINQAAEALHLQRSYLSRVVSTLEKQLGVTIFERVPKGVLPTSEGAYALERIEAALAILMELEQHFVSPERSYPRYHDELILYYPSTMRPRNQMIQIMERYRDRFPNVLLTLAEKHPNRVPQEIIGKNNALAVVLYSSTISYLQWPVPEQLRLIPLSQSPVVALAAKGHSPAEDYQTISLATLCKQKLVLMDPGNDDPPAFYRLLSDYGTPNVKHIVSGNLTLFYELLATGRYFSLGIANSLSPDELKQIPLRENIMVSSGLLFDPAVLDNFPAKVLLETVLEQLGHQDALDGAGGGPS